MKKTRTRILEDILIHKEKIKTESNSLKVDCTAEDLNASITCIESNKLEQETSTKGKNTIPTDKKYWEPNHYAPNGDKGDYPTRMRLIDLEKCEANTEYYVSKNVFILRGYNSNKDFIQNIGVINGINNQTFTTAEEVVYLGVSVDKIYDEYDEETDQLMICKMSETDKSWEKGYVDIPSTKYKSKIECVTGDVKLLAHNKNFAQNINYFNVDKQFLYTVKGDYKLQKDKFYIISCDTENTGEKVYINQGVTSGYAYIESWGIMQKICNGNRVFWRVKALDSDWHRLKNIVNKSSVNEGTTEGIFTGFTNNFMIEEIPVQTKEEALKYVPSEFVECKKQNFTISLGNKMLYKGDKIVRKDGKWYFSKHWKEFDRDIVANDVNRVSQGFYFGVNKLNGIKQGSKIYSTHQKQKDVVDNEWNCFDGNYAGMLYPNNHRGIYINYIADTKDEILEWYNNLSNKFIYELENEEPELIEDEILINQLDKILLNIYEYDDEINFDFDKEVIFEVEVKKDKLRILENRLDTAEQNTTSATMLALESEV